MALTLITGNTADRLLGALCDTLLHSLWQGILLAAIAGLVVICTRKASSALRYNLLIAVLLLFAAGVSVTFVWQYQKSGEAVAAQHFIQQAPTPNVAVITDQGAPAAHPSYSSFTNRVYSYLNAHHNTIVLIWFLIICARSLQLGVGLYGTYRLKTIRVFMVKHQWTQRLLQLGDALGIKQTITLLESGLAKAPMVIGHLKPVVLVPIGLLTALSAEEVEAILIHELAHIKRRDYLVNMLQSLAEIIFFFNPAVLWISKLIKTERENCCDDLALAQNNNKLSYIRALVSCAEYQAAVPVFAMGFPGGKNTLLNRVKRVASNRNYSLNMFEKTVLAVCLVVLGLGMSAFVARENIKKTIHTMVAAIGHDHAPQKIKLTGNDTTKKKRPAPANNVNEVLDKLRQLSADTLKNAGNAPLAIINHNHDSLAAPSILAALKEKLSGLNNTSPGSPLLDTVRTIGHNIGRQLYRDGLVTDTNHLSISLNERELIVNGVRMPEQVHARYYRQFGRRGENGNYGGNNVSVSASSDGSYNDHDTMGHGTATAYSSAYSGDGVNYHADSNGYKGRSNYELLSKKRQQHWAEQQKKIIADLLKDGLITDPKNMSFSLTNKKFVVNGQKQSEEVYNKYKEKYMPNNTGTWNWNYSNHE